MIKVDIRMPTKVELTRTAMAEIEKQIARKAQNAAARHGGVTIRFSRKEDGGIRKVEFQGSESAVAAARAAIGN